MEANANYAVEGNSREQASLDAITANFYKKVFCHGNTFELRHHNLLDNRMICSRMQQGSAISYPSFNRLPSQQHLVTIYYEVIKHVYFKYFMPFQLIVSLR